MRPVATNMGLATKWYIELVISNTIKMAAENGISEREHKKAELLLEAHRDAFQVNLGYDPPSKRDPLVVVLKKGKALQEQPSTVCPSTAGILSFHV